MKFSSKKLENLYKLLTVVYPENTDFYFNDIVQKILEYFMFELGYQKSEKDSLLYIQNEYSFKKTEYFAPEVFDLFTESYKRIHLFKKKLKTLRLKYDVITILDKLATSEQYIQNFIDEEQKKLRYEIQSKIKSEKEILYKQKKSENNKNRGNFYTEELSYNKPTEINFDKICLVHATSYYPKKNKDNQYYIETTAHATGFLSPRPTVHFTCNHIVQEHSTGAAWSQMPYVIIAPFEDIVKNNGAPRRFGLVDTYFLPDQEAGVVLPENVMIVEPGNKIPDNKLFVITPNNHAYYRVENFSDYQKQQIAGTDWKQKPDDYFVIQAKNMAVKEIMDLNGFNYLDGDMLDNYTMHQNFYKSGQKRGLVSVAHKYVHVHDSATFFTGSYENILSIIQDILDNKTIDGTNKEIIEDIIAKWLHEHVLNDLPVAELEINTADGTQIKTTKEKYNAAVKKLQKRLKDKIKDEQNIQSFIADIKYEK